MTSRQNRRGRSSGSKGSHPILNPNSRHAVEFAHIVGDDNQAFAAGVTANLNVVRTAWRSRPLQLCPTLTVMGGRLVLDRQYVGALRDILAGRQFIGAAF